MLHPVRTIYCEIRKKLLTKYLLECAGPSKWIVRYPTKHRDPDILPGRPSPETSPSLLVHVKKLANPIPNHNPNPNIDIISKIILLLSNGCRGELCGGAMSYIRSTRASHIHRLLKLATHASDSLPVLLVAPSVQRIRPWLQCSVRQSSVITDQSDAAADAAASFLTYLADDRRRALPC